MNMSILGEGLGAALLEARTTAGLTRAAVAQKIGVSAEAISRWERGDAQPSVVNLFGYVDACDVTLDDIVDFAGAEYAPLIKVTSQQRWDAMCDREEAL